MIFLFLFSIVSTSGCLEDEVSNSNNIDESNSDNYYDYNDNSNNQDTGPSNLDSDSDGYDDNNDAFPNDKKPLPLREITGEEIIATARQLNEFVTEK